MRPVERTTRQNCIPEGRTVSYQCTVTDPLDPPVASTVWLGSAFNCPSASDTSNNRITLTHSSFEPNGTSGVCGGLSAMSVGVDGRNHTSRLTLTATTGMNGETVECSLGGQNEVGTDTISVGGKYRRMLYIPYNRVPPPCIYHLSSPSPFPCKYHGGHLYILVHCQLDPTF